MGPKKKAPKKTKEELEEERRLQEEAEARARAEEEKRLEEERKRRELEAARRREEASQKRAAELEQLAHEADVAQPDLDGKASRLADILRAKKESSDWERYVACEPRPNAEVEGDLNSFVNAWLVDASSAVDESQPLPAVVKAVAAAASVLDDLQFAAAGARATNDSRLAAQCARFTTQLRSLVIEQVELTTARVLQYADEYADMTAPAMTGTGLNNANAVNRGEVRLSSAEGGVGFGLWVNLLAKSGRGKKVDFGESVGVAVDLPKAMLLQSLALRALHWPFDYISCPNNGESGSNVVALGGIFAIELLAIPPPPKRAHGWVMRELPDSGSSGSQQQHTKRLNYPLDGMVASAALPIKVSLTLPAQVSLAAGALSSYSALSVGWWDSVSSSWQEEGISDVVLAAETNSITFSTLRLAPLAVLQRKDLHYHKHYWKLTMDTSASSTVAPKGATSSRALLTLSTETLDNIQFLITDAGCALLSPAVPHLVPEEIRNGSTSPVYLEPGELLTRLAACGIDLCPPSSNKSDSDDAATSAYRPGEKNKIIEDRVMDEIVRIVASYEVRLADFSLLAAPPDNLPAYPSGDENNPEEYGPDYSSMTRWLAAVDDPSKIVFTVREVLWPYLGDEDHDPIGNVEDMRASPVTVLAELDSEASGGGVTFRLDRSCRADPYDSHVHLSTALEAFSSPDARDRMAGSNVLFEYTLKKLLRLLRLFSTSTPVIASTSSSALGSASFGMANSVAGEFGGTSNGSGDSTNGNNELSQADSQSGNTEAGVKELMPENLQGESNSEPAAEAITAVEPVA